MRDVDDGVECETGPPAALQDAVRSLRGPVSMRGDWREALLRAASALPAPRAEPAGFWRAPALGGRSWVLSPAAGIAAALRCALLAPGASRVALVGDFNGWNPASTPLRATGDGYTWSVSVPLAPGRHV